MEDGYKTEIQVGITSLVAGLGFFKTQELIDFISSIKGANLVNPDYYHLITSFTGFIFYIGYLGSVAASLYFIYNNKPKNHSTSILFAICCYFALQLLLILLIWNDDIVKIPK